MKLTGNTILITGGGTGIGRGLAEQFHARGNQVVIAGRRSEPLEQTARAHPGMEFMLLDIEAAENIHTVAQQVIARYPALNTVIHNAGMMKMENLRAGNYDLGDAEATVRTNLLGPMRLTAALLPHFLRQNYAAIMTVSSGLAFTPLALNPTYCATKAAIHSYTESLRYQLKDTAIEVIELIPPYVQTGLTGERQAKDPAAMPLDEFISETMRILESSRQVREITVERVKPLRFAAAHGNYDEVYTQMNEAVWAARQAEFGKSGKSERSGS